MDEVKNGKGKKKKCKYWNTWMKSYSKSRLVKEMPRINDVCSMRQLEETIDVHMQNMQFTMNEY
jgi:hypothetical protein